MKKKSTVFQLKRGLVIITCLLINMCALSQESYTINFDEKDFSIKVEDNVAIIVANVSEIMQEGDTASPSLPYLGYRILIPKSQSAKEFNASFTKKLLYKNVKIRANSEIVPTNVVCDEPDNRFASKSVLSPVKWSGDNYCAGYKYGFFSITPFIYDADKQELYFVSSIQLTILNTLDTESNSPIKAANFEKRADVLSMLYNPEKMDVFYPISSTIKQEQAEKGTNTTTIDYVIITNNSLLDSFKELARWKTMKGVRTEVFSKESIDSHYSGSSIQQKIKNFLQYYHNNYGTTFALLGGDDTIVPVQYCGFTANYISGNGPTDLYYACFSWDGNNIIGDQSALEPDIYVTRLPVRTSDDVEAITNKILKYEQNPSMDNYVKNILLVGSKLYIENGGVTDSYAKCQKIFSAIDSAYINHHMTLLSDTVIGSSIALTTDKLIDEINYGGHHLMYVSTHGIYNSWLYDNNSSHVLFSTSNVDNDLSNQDYLIIATEACHTNSFDYSSYPCLSESLIRKVNAGAIAYFGSSREGWTNKSFNNLGPSFDYNQRFFKNLRDDYPYHNYGIIAANAKSILLNMCNTNVTNYEYYRWLQYYINPIGDAEMPVYTDNPTLITNPVITRSGSNVVVTISNASSEKAYLTSIDEAHSIMKKEEFVNNTCTFSNVTEPYNIVITAHNKKPFVYDYMKKTRTDGINTKTVSGTNYYYLNINPDSVTINWSLPYPYNNLVHANPSALNECYISESGNSIVTSTLTGTVEVNGRLVETFRKSVSFSVTAFYGTYSQAACTYNGVSHPAIPATPYYSTTNTTYFIHQGCQVTLTSNNFSGMNVTYGGPATPTNWNPYDSTHVSFSLPSSSNGLPLYVYVKDLNGNTLYTSVFLGVLNNGNLYGYSLLAFPTVNGFEISILTDEGLVDNTEGDRNEIAEVGEWDLEVYNVLKGRKVFTGHVVGKTYQLDTSGWESGLYSVRAIINGEVLCEKIMVK